MLSELRMSASSSTTSSAGDCSIMRFLFVSLAEQRQADPEGAAATGCAFDPDTAAHRGDIAARDVESETGPAHLAVAATLDLIEAVEDALVLGLGDARSLIGHSDRQR